MEREIEANVDSAEIAGSMENEMGVCCGGRHCRQCQQQRKIQTEVVIKYPARYSWTSSDSAICSSSLLLDETNRKSQMGTLSFCIDPILHTYDFQSDGFAMLLWA